MKKLVSLILVLGMLLTLVGCGGNAETPTDPVNNPSDQVADQPTVAEEVEPVKITLFPLNANAMSGEVGGWIGDYLAENGIILEIMAYSEDKLNAMLSGGDLPDIIYLPAGTDFLTLAESGLLLDLDPYLDQMPNLTANETYVTAMNYTKEFVTDGTLTMLPQNVGPAAVSTTTTQAVKLNWEVYESIGCPEFKNMDELVDVLKQMQAAYPTDANGGKTYAMHLFNSMDSNYFYGVAATYNLMGYSMNDLAYGVETDQVNKSWDWIFEDDSAYKESLKFMNRLYLEGLLDPDSITQDRDTAYAKIEEANNALATWTTAPGYEAYGFYPAYFEAYVLNMNKQGYPYGGGSFAAVSAKTENLETVLRFLNLSADTEAVRILANGPKGELWDRDSEGKLVITEKGIAAYVNGEDVSIGDEKYVFFNTPWLIHPNTADPIDGECVNVANSMTFQLISNDNAGQQKWAENYGYTDIRTMLQDKGQEIGRFDENAQKFAENPDDNQSLIIAAARDIIVTESWKLVYAKDEAEFEQVWADLVAEVEELGFKDVYEWRIEALQKGLDIRDSLAG